MAKFFAGVDVGHVYFDDRHRQDRQGVAQGDAVVRPGPGVDQDGIDCSR